MKARYYEALEAALQKDAEQIEANAGGSAHSPTLSESVANALGRGVTLKTIVAAVIGGFIEDNAGFAGGIAAVDAL